MLEAGTEMDRLTDVAFCGQLWGSCGGRAPVSASVHRHGPVLHTAIFTLLQHVCKCQQFILLYSQVCVGADGLGSLQSPLRIKMTSLISHHTIKMKNIR